MKDHRGAGKGDKQIDLTLACADDANAQQQMVANQVQRQLLENSPLLAAAVQEGGYRLMVNVVPAATPSPGRDARTVIEAIGT